MTENNNQDTRHTENATGAQDMRAAFKKWYLDNFVVHSISYEERCWKAWQAATKKEQAEIASLKSKIDSLDQNHKSMKETHDTLIKRVREEQAHADMLAEALQELEGVYKNMYYESAESEAGVLRKCSEALAQHKQRREGV